ncbi:hypothetical protein FY528_02130 [Hymenobacter lutimineralis]|uniref:Uncharacterized protein n=1 Tax=Hymenobacter lutimineralis TaxID=2606448 RepID=A0A5D6VG97_9BACT|nr:hypothetical protein [Hymenobacter lutimineralis]TYZ14546.1 hypothetical protein FY528_02130 [Hymenobacter lutimineralis]
MKRELLIITGLILIVTGGALEYHRRQLLWEEFAIAHDRLFIDRKYAAFTYANGMAVAMQAPGTVEEDYNFANTFVVGINYQWSRQRYERLLRLVGLDPRREAVFIRAASDYYQSDSTYLDGLSRSGKTTEALIYRKTDPAKVADMPKPEVFNYMVWRRERVTLQNGRIQARLIEEMNQEHF